MTEKEERYLQLIEEYQDQLFRLCRAYPGKDPEIEDLIQDMETIEKDWEKR